MTYFRETRTGHYHPPYKRTEITRQEAIIEIGEKNVRELEQSMITHQHSSSSIQSISGAFVGVRF